MRITSILKFKSLIKTPIGANKKTRGAALVFNYVSVEHLKNKIYQNQYY